MAIYATPEDKYGPMMAQAAPQQGLPMDVEEIMSQLQQGGTLGSGAGSKARVERERLARPEQSLGGAGNAPILARLAQRREDVTAHPYRDVFDSFIQGIPQGTFGNDKLGRFGRGFAGGYGAYAKGRQGREAELDKIGDTEADLFSKQAIADAYGQRGGALAEAYGDPANIEREAALKEWLNTVIGVGNVRRAESDQARQDEEYGYKKSQRPMDEAYRQAKIGAMQRRGTYDEQMSPTEKRLYAQALSRWIQNGGTIDQWEAINGPLPEGFAGGAQVAPGQPGQMGQPTTGADNRGLMEKGIDWISGYFGGGGSPAGVQNEGGYTPGNVAQPQGQIGSMSDAELEAIVNARR